MPAHTQHDDFGEKIGGARKDLWQKRGLLSGDLDEMNSREADKYVKKDNTWKKPDYEAMIQNGIPKEQKVPKGYAIRYNDGSSYAKNDDWLLYQVPLSPLAAIAR